MKALLTSRWVTGMPQEAGTAKALETPGTIRTPIPAATQASISSPPRPKTNGSPPFSRTTDWPRRARLIICSEMELWGTGWW